LPVEVWTRFMRTAHQGVPVASLPRSQAGSGGLLSNLFQASSQVSAPSQPSYQPSAQAPVQLAPIPSGGGYRPPPTRTSAPPPNPNARPEAASGLDGWLIDRVFGGNR
jgi:penicillin-binding protein 1A